VENFILSVISKTEAQILIYLVIANLILGVVRAVVIGEFEFAKLADFWKTTLGVFGGYLSVAIVSIKIADFVQLRDVAWIALVALLVSKIKDNLKEMGVPIPNIVNNFVGSKK